MEKDDTNATLFGGGGSPVENRKLLNFWARFTISLGNGATFLILLYLLLFADVLDTRRSLINIFVGAYVAVLEKSTDYWFKDKSDPEHDEIEKREV